MKTILSLIISGALVASGYAQTRNVLVGTNNAVVQPTNFWSADASNARSGLGLGSAATNPASAFQTSSSALTNLASGNGGALTNLQSTNLVGLIPTSNIPATTLTNISGTLAIVSGGTGATNASNARVNLGATTIGDALFVSTNAESARSIIGALSTNGNAINLTNFPPILLRTNGSAASLTNFPNEVFALSNSTGVLSLLNGGTGATNASGVRTNLGLGTAATNPATAFQPASTVLSNLASSNGAALTNIAASNITGTIAISNGGSGATTAGGARTNLGLGATNSVVFSNLSLSNGAQTSLALAIGSTNHGFFATAGPERIGVVVGGSNVASFFSGSFEVNSQFSVVASAAISSNLSVGGPISFIGASSNIAITRTNLGLGWPALTNSNTGTGLVSVNTNGEVVSPTNFWQVAPIVTRFVEFQPSTNATTNIVAARNLHIHSLALAITGVTSTIALPTNNVFDGDIALVVHQGPTSSVTQVRTQGSTNNLVTMNRTEEAVEFVYYNSVWQFNHNRSFIEPIYFSGTNAVANAAASRTNLGLGATWLTNTNVTNFRTAVGLGATNDVEFNSVGQGGGFRMDFVAGTIYDTDPTNVVFSFASGTWYVPITFSTNTVAATTRTNLGLGATNIVTFAGLTNNGDITINQTTATNGLLFIRRTNNEAFLGMANLIASNNTTVSNETLFRVGVAEATNKSAQFGFRSTNTNGDGVAVFSVFGYNALMMIGPSDPAAGTNPIEATVYSVNPSNKVMTLIKTNTGATLFHRPIEFENTTNQAVTRTNLGLPLAALTNTNNANFQAAVFNTNTTPAGSAFNTIVAWMEVHVFTNGSNTSFRVPLFK